MNAIMANVVHFIQSTYFSDIQRALEPIPLIRRGFKISAPLFRGWRRGISPSVPRGSVPPPWGPCIGAFRRGIGSTLCRGWVASGRQLSGRRARQRSWASAAGGGCGSGSKCPTQVWWKRGGWPGGRETRVWSLASKLACFETFSVVMWSIFSGEELYIYIHAIRSHAT